MECIEVVGVTHVVFRISVVGHDGDDGVVDEESEREHSTQAAKGALVHGHVLGRGDVVQVDVDAPDRRVIDDNPDQEDNSHGA